MPNRSKANLVEENWQKVKFSNSRHFPFLMQLIQLTPSVSTRGTFTSSWDAVLWEDVGGTVATCVWLWKSVR
jgi:hypothetical protein